MPSDFPVPRTELPKVHVSRQEYLARKLQMEHMVEQMVQEYEEYSETNLRFIDPRRWRQVATRERMKLYKERWSFVNGTTPSVNSTSTTSSANDEEGSRRMHRMISTSETAEKLKFMLLVGERPGRVEDAMHAVVAANQEELALVVVYLHEEVADCAILNTMEIPTQEEPFRYLGYKWFVKPSPGASRLVKNRDSLYVEYSGMTKTTGDAVLGYHLMHSIDIPNFPDFRDRNCVRISQSIRTLYYQKEPDVVEVFMMGNVDISGLIVSPIASVFAYDALFGMPRSVDCGEAKRLTELIRTRRLDRASRGRNLQQNLAPICSLCRHEKKMFSKTKLMACELCERTVCHRCCVAKRIFKSSGILGHYEKANCCKACLHDIRQAAQRGHNKSGRQRERSQSSRKKTSESEKPRQRCRSYLNSVQVTANINEKPGISITSTVPTEVGSSVGSYEEVEQDRASVASYGRSRRSSLIQELHDGDAVLRSSCISEESDVISIAPSVLGDSSIMPMPQQESDLIPLTLIEYPTQVSRGNCRGPHQHVQQPVTYRSRRHSVPPVEEDFFARMQRLNQMAEATYHTIQVNETKMIQMQKCQFSSDRGDQRRVVYS